MKRSKLIFTVIAAFVILACIVCAVIFGKQTEPPATDEAPSQPPTESIDQVIVPDIPPQEIIDPDPTDPPVVVDGNVTIRQSPKDPNEVIDRNPVTDPNHPEYLDGEETSPYLSSEGSVYRNDKVISIELVDQQSGDICTFSFGHDTGGCNRFLYLNPQFERNGKKIESNIYFKIDQPYGGGFVSTRGIDVEENINKNRYLNYEYYRAFEEKQVSGYVDAKHPGSFWFTSVPVENNIYIDVKAHYYQGGLFATLRLTIAKADDGTYSIVDIDNKDLLTNGENETYSISELAYILDITDTTYHTPGTVHTYNSTESELEMAIEDTIIEFREPEIGLYYNQFLPYSGSEWSKDYTDSQIPVMAVTYRWPGQVAMTMYFWVLKEPTETTHGTYQFIGYDFPMLQKLSLLNGYGYQGNG